MIRLNLMHQITLEEAVAPVAQSSSKKRWYFYGVAATLVLGAGLALSIPQIMDLILPAQTTEEAAPAPAPVAKDLPQNVTVDKIDEVDFKDKASVAAALESGKITTQTAVLGLSPAQLSQQVWTMLSLVKQNTPSTVRYARVILQAPNYMALQGLVDQPKDFQLWKSLLASKVEAMQADSLKAAGSGEMKIFNLALKVARPAQSNPVLATAQNYQEEASKFHQALKAVLAVQDLPKPTGQKQMGEWTLYTYEQTVPMADYDRLLQALEAVKNTKSPVGVLGVDLSANHGEGIDAVIRYAVFVGK